MKVQRMDYLYRDAGNYKFRGSVFVGGRFDTSDLTKFLISSEYFIPRRVGLRSLSPVPATDQDHDLHEIEDIAPVEDPLPEAISGRVLLHRFKRAFYEGWFIDASELDGKRTFQGTSRLL